jgi:4-aminobutyrate aminotransferase-like enzyme
VNLQIFLTSAGRSRPVRHGSNVKRMGDHLAADPHTHLSEHRHVGDIRGRGLFCDVELVADFTGPAAL